MKLVYWKNGREFASARFSESYVSELEQIESDKQGELLFSFSYDSEGIIPNGHWSLDGAYMYVLITITNDNKVIVSTTVIKEDGEINVKILLNAFEREQILCYILKKSQLNKQ